MNKQQTSACLVVMSATLLGCNPNPAKLELKPSDLGTQQAGDTTGQSLADDDSPINSSQVKSPAGLNSAGDSSKPSSRAIHVTIQGFKKKSGRCCVAAYLGSSHFNVPEYAVAKATLDIVDGQAEWSMAIDPGSADTIGISAYHDDNENSKLDKNSLGIPMELYGFSNNPKRGFGPPKYEETAIKLLTSESTTESSILEIAIEVK
jgi:uncharacterized protein (DUF2141 family)